MASLIEKLDTKFSTLNVKKNCIFWTGSLFNHIDNEYNCFRNRIEIYNKLQFQNNQYSSQDFVISREVLYNILKANNFYKPL